MMSPKYGGNIVSNRLRKVAVARLRAKGNNSGPGISKRLVSKFGGVKEPRKVAGGRKISLQAFQFKIWRCAYCPYETYTQKQFTMHNAHHLPVKSEDVTKLLIECPYCTYKENGRVMSIHFHKHVANHCTDIRALSWNVATKFNRTPVFPQPKIAGDLFKSSDPLCCEYCDRTLDNCESLEKHLEDHNKFKGAPQINNTNNLHSITINDQKLANDAIDRNSPLWVGQNHTQVLQRQCLPETSKSTCDREYMKKSVSQACALPNIEPHAVDKSNPTLKATSNANPPTKDFSEIKSILQQNRTAIDPVNQESINIFMRCPFLSDNWTFDNPDYLKSIQYGVNENGKKQMLLLDFKTGDYGVFTQD